MHLCQSVVLWQGRGGIQKIALFGKIPSPYYVKNSSNKHITLRQLIQSGKFQELIKFLQLQPRKPSTAMMKLSLKRTATRKEDPESRLLQRISSLELPASEIAAQINASQLWWTFLQSACQSHAPSKLETSVALCCVTKLHHLVAFYCPQHKVHLCNDHAV